MRPEVAQDKQFWDVGQSEGWARRSERSKRKEVQGKGYGPNGRFRDSEPVNVHTRKMKPGIGMAEGRDTDLGRSQERRNEVLCRRNGPRELRRPKY